MYNINILLHTITCHMIERYNLEMCLLILVREREKHRCEKHPLVASPKRTTKDQTHNLSMCPDSESNLRPSDCMDDAPTN